jgi:hypothetical protein
LLYPGRPKELVYQKPPPFLFLPKPLFFLSPGNAETVYEFGETKDRGLAYDEKGLFKNIGSLFFFLFSSTHFW